MRERLIKVKKKKHFSIFDLAPKLCIQAQICSSYMPTHTEKKKIEITYRNYILESGLKHKGKSHQPTMPFFTEESIEMSMAASEFFLSMLCAICLPSLCPISI